VPPAAVSTCPSARIKQLINSATGATNHTTMHHHQGSSNQKLKRHTHYCTRRDKRAASPSDQHPAASYRTATNLNVTSQRTRFPYRSAHGETLSASLHQCTGRSACSLPPCYTIQSVSTRERSLTVTARVLGSIKTMLGIVAMRAVNPASKVDFDDVRPPLDPGKLEFF
jgi:hypothetical protein